MPNIDLRGVATSSGAIPGATRSITVPSATQPGDLILMYWFAEDSGTTNPTITPPTGEGYTSYSDIEQVNTTPDLHSLTFYKWAGSNDASASHTWSVANCSWLGGFCVVLSNAVGTGASPFDVAETTQTGGSDNTPIAPDITPSTQPHMEVVWLCPFDGTTIPTISGMSEAAEIGPVSINYLRRTSTSAPGTRSATYTGTASFWIGSHQIIKEVPPYEQEGYRWRNDDGSESTATWLATQDTDITRPTATNTRLRILVDTASTDPAPTKMQLKYKLSTDSTYIAVEPLNTAVTNTPVLEGNNNGETSTNDLSHSISLPASIAKGELLLIVFSVDGNPTCSIDVTDYPGWIKLGQDSNGTAATGAIFAKIAEGSDTNPVVTTSASEQSTHITYRVSGAGWPSVTFANGSSTNSNPPNNDTGLSRNYRWIATRSGDAQVQATVAPTSYANLLTKTATNATGASTATADRANAVAAEDPGTFTSATEQWVSTTIAIPPADNVTHYINSGAVALATSGSLGAAVPTGIQKKQLLVYCIANRYSSNSMTTPTGWTAISNSSKGGGLGSDGTEDQGTTNATIFVKESDGTETGTVNSNVSGGVLALGRIFAYSLAPGRKWSLAATGGADNTAGTAWSVTGDADPGIIAGDVIIACSAINTDMATYSSQSMSATGTTFSTHTERQDSGTITNPDLALVVSEHRVSAGPSSAAPVFTMTGSTSGTNSLTGATVFLRIRQIDENIVISPSSNISASGANTTGQLTAPASGSFGGGRIQDDENPADTVDLATNEYGEWEWCLQATSTATNGDIYQFRLTRDGTVLDTYTVTPQWTIGTGTTTHYGEVTTSLIITNQSRAIASKIGRSSSSLSVNNSCIAKKIVSTECVNNLIVSNVIRGKSILAGRSNNSLFVTNTATGFSYLVGRCSPSLVITSNNLANKISIGMISRSCDISVSNFGNILATSQFGNSLVISGGFDAARGISATTNFIVSIANNNDALLLLGGNINSSLTMNNQLSGNIIVHPNVNQNFLIQSTNYGNIVAHARQTGNIVINSYNLGNNLLNSSGNLVLAISNINNGSLKLAGRSSQSIVINRLMNGNMITHGFIGMSSNIGNSYNGNIIIQGSQIVNLNINNRIIGSILLNSLISNNLVLNNSTFGVLKLSVSESGILQITTIIDAERIPGQGENEVFFGNVAALLQILSQIQGNVKFAGRSNQNLVINNNTNINTILSGKTNNILSILTTSQGIKNLIGSSTGLLQLNAQSYANLIATAIFGNLCEVRTNLFGGLRTYHTMINTLQLSSAYLGNIKTGVKSSGNLSIFSSVTPLRKLGGNISNSLSIIDSIQGNRILVSAVSTILSISPSVVARLISSGQISASLIIDVITDAELILPAVVIITFNGIVNPLIVNSLYINPLIQNTLDVNAGFSENMLIAVDGVDINMNIPLGLIFEAQV